MPLFSSFCHFMFWTSPNLTCTTYFSMNIKNVKLYCTDYRKAVKTIFNPKSLSSIRWEIFLDFLQYSLHKASFKLNLFAGPGICPTFDALECPEGPREDFCTADDDCLQGLKCCDTGCENDCIGKLRILVFIREFLTINHMSILLH